MKIVIISGPCGAGKSTVTRILAESSQCPLTVHFHTDDFYQYIRKGYLPPWTEESGDQNETVMTAIAASAEQFSAGGYEVYVDGMIGPWFLGPWQRIAGKGADIRYVILRPDEQTTIRRASEREQREEFPLQIENVKQIWQSMADLGEYESYAVDTSTHSPEESARLIQRLLKEEAFRIKGC